MGYFSSLFRRSSKRSNRTGASVKGRTFFQNPPKSTLSLVFVAPLIPSAPVVSPVVFLPDALPDACLPLLGPGEEEEEVEGREVDQTKQAEEGKKKSGLGKIERGRKDVVEEGKVRGRKGSWHSHIQPPSRAQEVAIGGEWHTFVFFLVSVLISVTVLLNFQNPFVNDMKLFPCTLFKSHNYL